jgi:hypothetical protein
MCARLEHVPEKLTDFSDQNRLQEIDFLAYSYRSDDSIRSEYALVRREREKRYEEFRTQFYSRQGRRRQKGRDDSACCLSTIVGNIDDDILASSSRLKLAFTRAGNPNIWTQGTVSAEDGPRPRGLVLARFRILLVMSFYILDFAVLRQKSLQTDERICITFTYRFEVNRSWPQTARTAIQNPMSDCSAKVSAGCRSGRPQRGGSLAFPAALRAIPRDFMAFLPRPENCFRYRSRHS